MGTKERKEREKERRKEQILSAAIELISEKGFDHVTMEEIAQQAEFSKGTLYLYFNDKLSLYIEIKRIALQELHNEFLRVLQEDESGADLLKLMGLRYLNFLRENPIYLQSMIQPEIALKKDPEFKDMGRELLTLVTNAVKIGIQDGSVNPNVNPKILAIQLGWCFFGILQFFISDSAPQFKEILNENDTDLNTMIREYIDALICNNHATQFNN